MLYLPRLQDLDVADIQDILEHVSLWKEDDPDSQRIYRLELMDFLKGREINPFRQLFIEEAIQEWLKEKIMANTIIAYVTPEQIQDTYIKGIALLEDKKRLELEKIMLTEKIAQGYAEAVKEGRADKGKNDDERENTRRTLFPELYGLLETNKKLQAENQNARDLVKVELEHYDRMIAYFGMLKEA